MARPWRRRAQAGPGRLNRAPRGRRAPAFGPQPRSYTFKVNRKEQRAALRSGLSLHAGRGSLAILDPSAFTEPATRKASELLEDWDAPRPTLVALAAEEAEAALSFRNLSRVAVLAVENVGVTDLLGAASLLLSGAALEALTERARGKQDSEERSIPPKTNPAAGGRASKPATEAAEEA